MPSLINNISRVKQYKSWSNTFLTSKAAHTREKPLGLTDTRFEPTWRIEPWCFLEGEMDLYQTNLYFDLNYDFLKSHSSFLQHPVLTISSNY